MVVNKLLRLVGCSIFMLEIKFCDLTSLYFFQQRSISYVFSTSKIGLNNGI